MNQTKEIAKNVWIFQTGEPLHIDGQKVRGMRCMNLADALVKKGHKVTIWSTDFYHQEKRHRRRAGEVIQITDGLAIRLIPSAGYLKNIGLGRLFDHAQLAFNLRSALRKEKCLPDVAFVGYPPIEFAWYAVKFLARRSVPTLLDVKDNWPEFFVTPFPDRLKWLARLVLFPYFILGRSVMRNADGICSMAPSFLSWVQSFSKRLPSPNDGVFPLAPPEFAIDPVSSESARRWWESLGVKSNDSAKFLFVGSFSAAFDFDTIARVASRALKENKNWQFVICGAGGDAENIIRTLSGFSNVVLPGWVNREQIDVVARWSVAGLAPYRNMDNFIKNIPNKVIDYLSLSLPIVTPLRGEVESMISQNKAGLLYTEGNEDELYERLSFITSDPSNRAVMAENSRRIYDDFFQYDRVYGKLVIHLEKMAGNNHA